VIDLHGDGEIGDGVFEHQRVFKLALLVDVGELAELLVGVVALAVIELRIEFAPRETLMRRKWPFLAVLVV
jgi:hypothetical protein